MVVNTYIYAQQF